MGDVLLSVSKTSVLVPKQNPQTLNITETVELKKWQHFCILWSKTGKMDFYIDGNFQTGGSTQPPPQSG